MPDNKPEPPWIDLAKISHEDFKSRRDLEWKLAYGFWTVIAAFTYLACDKQLHLCWCWLLCVYIVVFFVVGIFWLLPLQGAHSDNRAYWKYYLRNAEGSYILDTKGSIRAPHPETRPYGNWGLTNTFWFTAEWFVTGIFLLLSFATITRIREQPKKPAAPQKDGRQASRFSDAVLASRVFQGHTLRRRVGEHLRQRQIFKHEVVGDNRHRFGCPLRLAELKRGDFGSGATTSSVFAVTAITPLVPAMTILFSPSAPGPTGPAQLALRTSGNPSLSKAHTARMALSRKARSGGRPYWVLKRVSCSTAAGRERTDRCP